MERIIDLGHDMARIWAQYYPAYMTGVRNTLILAFIATLAGGIIGFICGILNTIPYSKNDPAVKRGFIAFIRAIVRIYVEFFRGTPMVLQAVFIFYGLPYFTFNKVQFTGNSGIWIASLIIVSINTGAYMAESVRGGILSIDRGQTEGAMAIGMNHIQTMTSVIMPQALGSEQLYNQHKGHLRNVHHRFYGSLCPAQEHSRHKLRLFPVGSDRDAYIPCNDVHSFVSSAFH